MNTISHITQRRRGEAREYNSGRKSGLLHNDKDPLCVDNLRKMQSALEGQFTEPLIKSYWLGYRDGLQAR